MYGMYISFSSAAHGSPNSLVEVLDLVDGRLIPKRQPEVRPNAHHVGAFVLLVWTIEAFAEDARLRQQCGPDIRSVSKPLKAMAKKAKQKSQAGS